MRQEFADFSDAGVAPAGIIKMKTQFSNFIRRSLTGLFGPTLLALWLLSACGSDGGSPDAAIDVPGDVSDDAGDIVGTDTAPDGVDVQTDGVTDDNGQEPDTAVCQQSVALPKPARLWIGTEHAADRKFLASEVVIDNAGNLVGVDLEGNIVRQTYDGVISVWVPKAVKTARGLAFLSTGELVVADSGRGMLVKIYADGQVRTLVQHMDFPNGLDVDRDDTIYVSEASLGAITKVNPHTGATETLHVGMRVAPNGLAFSPDYQTLYIAGVGNGAIYAMDRDGDGAWGQLHKLAMIPGLEGVCAGKQLGDDCDLDGTSGTCHQRDDGGPDLYCVAKGPCFGLAEGDSCQGDWYAGLCTADDVGELYCRQVNACEDKAVDEECLEFGVYGTCQDDGAGGLFCRAAGACDEKVAGDACVEWDTPGFCTDDGTGYLYCRPVQPCDGKIAGDICDSSGQAGLCQDDGGGTLYCYVPGPCDGKAAGDNCEADGQAGICREDQWLQVYCRLPSVCDSLEMSAPCVENDVPGTCEDDGTGLLICMYVDPCSALSAGDLCLTSSGTAGECTEGWDFVSLYCTELSACHGLTPGAVCNDFSNTSGICTDDLNGGLSCQTTVTCSGATAQDACQDPYTGFAGSCVPTADGTGLYCTPINPCSGLNENDNCVVSNSPIWPRTTADRMVITPNRNGRCAVGTESILYCRPVGACEGLQAGAACTNGFGSTGKCMAMDDGSLYCRETGTPCQDLRPGDACKNTDGSDGFCVDDGSDYLQCVGTPPCEGLNAGDACTDLSGLDGTCVSGEYDVLTCHSNPGCLNKQEGADCKNVETTMPGTCITAAGGILLCQPTPPCADKTAGTECTAQDSMTGTCTDTGNGGELVCETSRVGGSLHGLNVDACGNIYVTDDQSDAIWRFSSDGKTATLVARTFHSPVSGAFWGRAGHGWKNSSLYLSVGGGAELLEIDLGIPGRRLVIPKGEPAKPEGLQEEPEIDCMSLPETPVATENLDAPRGYHDVAFDQEGYIVGYDGFNLIRVNHDGQVENYAMGLTGVQGMDWLPDGSLVVAADAGLVKIEPSGAQTVLASGVIAYGVTVGPDGKIYAGDNAKLYRVDPAAPVGTEAEVYLDPARNPSDSGTCLPRTITFDRDHSVMYIGGFGESVYVLSLDKDLNPIGSPRHFALVRSSSNFLDGQAIDACGNLYIPNFESSALYRVTPDGITKLYYQQDNVQYGHGVEWGSGIGGWKTDALYLPQPYSENHVIEISVGVVGGPK
jgi:sugar lactone lactonase YvrE